MQRIEKYLLQADMKQWGVCDFSDFTLLPVRSVKYIPMNAESVILCLFGYYTEEYTNRNIARYAISDDYHTVLLPKLQRLADTLAEAFPQEKFVPFIDASPIPEVFAAYLAGLGEIGENGLLLSQEYGSRCFIGEIVTTLHLKNNRSLLTGICLNCSKCITACPSGALTMNGFLKDKCRSYITQKKGELTLWEQNQIAAGQMAWGCDCCVDACPMNQEAKKSTVAEFYENRVSILTFENVKALCKTKAYGWRKEKTLLRNLSYLKEKPTTASKL